MRLKNGFVLREMCGEHIVSGEGIEHINFNKLISLNSTAAFLWKEAEGRDFTAETLAELLIDRYGIDKELAMKDSENLINAWIEAGIAE
jgi:hypothetical protein